MNLFLQTKENVLFPESDGEQEKSGSDGEGERGQIILNVSCVCL